ncbi:MAG: glycerate kinase [Caldilineaceae bacterium]|nr:glycerate kinase [Caldilineaceae bacterium]MBP8106666.1 glycerate kinase [Caldilineaceae bacterium]MBP8122194.1 glycerate kinase [Caldilineaceae bacterium]MBP9071717.1 glycerate kinase [Caldilineaceae bacterium]
MPVHPDILVNNPKERQPIVQILNAALAAVNPHTAVMAALHRDGDRLILGKNEFDLAQFDRVIVIGAGKAGAPMAQAVEKILGERISAGLVVVKTGHGGPTRTVEIAEATHPVPDQAGADAGARILALAEGAGERDLVIALISGGGSALLTAPAPPLSLGDLQGAGKLLLGSGATIQEFNCVRKHLSAVKGGQLARAAAPATVITLVLSDVVGSPLDAIASGPTVADPTTWADAWAVVTRYNLADQLPLAVVDRLRAGLAGDLADTPKPGDPIFARTVTQIVADNRVAALAACEAARGLGFNTLLLSTFVEGEAAEVAKLAVALGREVQASGNPVVAPACLVLGGETTVTLGQNPGLGGRNQELALAAALGLEGTAGITVVSLATDGSDGPTESAGGLVDGGTVQRSRNQGLDAPKSLRGHDAYPFLKKTGDLLMTGPTQTNVNDLIFVFVTPPQS